MKYSSRISLSFGAWGGTKRVGSMNLEYNIHKWFGLWKDSKLGWNVAPAGTVGVDVDGSLICCILWHEMQSCCLVVCEVCIRGFNLRGTLGINVTPWLLPFPYLVKREVFSICSRIHVWWFDSGNHPPLQAEHSFPLLSCLLTKRQRCCSLHLRWVTPRWIVFSHCKANQNKCLSPQIAYHFHKWLLSWATRDKVMIIVVDTT